MLFRSLKTKRHPVAAAHAAGGSAAPKPRKAASAAQAHGVRFSYPKTPLIDTLNLELMLILKRMDHYQYAEGKTSVKVHHQPGNKQSYFRRGFLVVDGMVQ